MPPTIIESAFNPYHDEVQGKANEPIAVAALLDRAALRLGLGPVKHSLGEIVERLDRNAPRVAVIGGSADHPAHIVDLDTVFWAATRIWKLGGVPFYFSLPVLCDGTAQSHTGMSYSLHSRNLTAETAINQMEAHAYHAAFVISGCDKTPLGIASGLALLDRTRQRRGDAPLWATFAPAHVLRGGTIPPDLVEALDALAFEAGRQGHEDIARDLRAAMGTILQCISNAAFQGILIRARQVGLLDEEEHKMVENALAAHTCHAQGGICAFNGTGNSTRHVLSALGLAHPALDLLPKPAMAAQIERAVDDLFALFNRTEYSVSEIVRRNWANAVRIHSATGGSTNLSMHLVALMLYAGVEVSVADMDRIRRSPPVPDLFDYSLSEGRDIHALARQTADGLIRGMETVFYELGNNGIPMDVDAPTVTGTTWAERLSNVEGLPADGVERNPIILSRPRRPFSGIDVLAGNWFESAVIKIGGMSDEQIDAFDDRVAVVLFWEDEDAANEGLLDVHLLDGLREHPALTPALLSALARYNGRGAWQPDPRGDLFDQMVEAELLKLMVVISGQGPQAFGMPEMFTPMQHINNNRALRRLAALISDGRYSGTSYGAAVGHVTPEAFCGGQIGVLETGDLLHVRLRERRIDLLDAEAFLGGELVPWDVDLRTLRRGLYRRRRARMRRRLAQIAVTNRMQRITDAAHGVVPLVVAREADIDYASWARQQREQAAQIEASTPDV